ncbi:cytochrome P450 [Amycolatopsis anabasis]|uniref:cytochrome P450 n=1 Tax=Amycolatopsis anabasis TaxID=1840409 RepID=UPI00131DE120|nr:cytochrome P450 [Amycolatopsis anabasis]
MNLTEFRMTLRTLPFLDAHAHSPHGLLQLRARPTPRLLVWHPDAIEQIFRTDRQFHHPGSRSLMPLLGRSSLLWADGPRHPAYRGTLGPPLRNRGLASYRDAIADTVHSSIDELPTGRVIPLAEWTRQVALRVIAKIVLGRADDELLAPFIAWIDKALGSRSRTLYYRYLSGGLPGSGEQLDRLLIRAARASASANPPALAALLLTENGPLGEIDRTELRDQIVSLLFAGHETTASATAWTLYWLDRDERVRDDVLTELEATSDDGSDVTRVPLLQAVIQEALRLTPPVPAAGNRMLDRGGELLGRELPAGTILTPSIYLAHRRAEYFPRPRRFDPYRFLGRRVGPQHFFPFGGGARHCLGSQLSQLEARMITVALLRRRELRCVNPAAGVPRLRGHAMAPDSKLRMKVMRNLDD